MDTKKLKKNTVAQRIPDVIRPEKKGSSVRLGYNMRGLSVNRFRYLKNYKKSNQLPV